MHTDIHGCMGCIPQMWPIQCHWMGWAQRIQAMVHRLSTTQTTSPPGKCHSIVKAIWDLWQYFIHECLRIEWSILVISKYSWIEWIFLFKTSLICIADIYSLTTWFFAVSSKGEISPISTILYTKCWEWKNVHRLKKKGGNESDHDHPSR